jgi:two-component system, NtrC family, response regulator AtoC
MFAETAHALRSIRLPKSDQIFGCTAGMKEVRAEIEQAMRDDLPVLIEGESGTGKEVVARCLHLNSSRAPGPFVRVNCGSVQGSMLDSEIFGDSSGASRAQDETRGGAIGLASGGTLFFDGISEMGCNLNRRMARVLTRAASVDARIVCASSRNVQIGGEQERVLDPLQNCFGHRVHLLPLRHRKQDIPMLCEYLIGEFARAFDRPVPRLSSYVLDVFQQWNWPGNIRELENWIARIVIFGTEEAIGPKFKGQMGVSDDRVARPHRAIHLNFTRTRRSRRRG